MVYNIGIVNRIRNISSAWFYSNPHPLLRLLTIYVNGDMLIIIPGLVAIGVLGFFSIKFMLLMYGVFYALRGLGEMMYWFSQQFWLKEYRPDDFGFKKLNNDAIYILYQLMATLTTAVGIGFVCWVLLYLY